MDGPCESSGRAARRDRGRQHTRSQWSGRKTLRNAAHGVHARTGTQVGNAVGRQRGT